VGDSTNARHPGEVALTSYSQNASNPVNLTKKGDTALCGQITIMKQIDRSSPEFLGKVLTGSVSSATVPVTITFEKFATEVAFQFYKVELYQVAVTSITQSDFPGRHRQRNHHARSRTNFAAPSPHRILMGQ
jgi:type VI protein secretion system component Hcp